MRLLAGCVKNDAHSLRKMMHPLTAAPQCHAQTSPLCLQKKVFPNKRGPPRPPGGDDAAQGDAAAKDKQEQVKDDERGQEEEEEEEVVEGKDKKIVR